MNSVVLKIGGGILRDQESFLRVVDIVKNKLAVGEKQIIVISALYGVTDFLINSLKECVLNQSIVEQKIIELKKMHFNYLEFISNDSIKQKAMFDLTDKISILEKFLYGVSYLKEISPRSKDLVQSFGERLSPIILEAFLLDAGLKARFIDAEEAGIVCKGNFENSFINLEKTSINLHSKIDNLLSSTVILLPGYYGVDDSGDVKTFGRGGTDYSSGFIANIFDAKLEIWKNVSGFMTADPQMVKNAIQIELLSYEEAEELGYLGAKIIHPKTIDPLRQKLLCAEVKNIFAPKIKGTIICSSKQIDEDVVKSISSIKEVAIISLESTSMVNVSGFASMIFSKLAEKNISIDIIVTSEASISFSLDPKQVSEAMDSLKTITEQYPCKVKLANELSVIAVVGEGLKKTPGIAGKLFSSLGKNELNVELISQGASEINITFAVNKSDLEKAVNVVHNEFIKR